MYWEAYVVEISIYYDTDHTNLQWERHSTWHHVEVNVVEQKVF